MGYLRAWKAGEDQEEAAMKSLLSSFAREPERQSAEFAATVKGIRMGLVWSGLFWVVVIVMALVL
jgi:hypothetical protein